MTATWVLVGSNSVSSVQSKTESAPALDTDGMSLTNVAGITVWLDAGDGETITADTGQVDIYGFDGGLWGSSPLLVLQVPPGSSGLRRVQLGTMEIVNARGRIAPIANTVPASGSTVTIDVLATAHQNPYRPRSA